MLGGLVVWGCWIGVRLFYVFVVFVGVGCGIGFVCSVYGVGGCLWVCVLDEGFDVVVVGVGIFYDGWICGVGLV